jgi:hypothetical protein
LTTILGDLKGFMKTGYGSFVDYTANAKSKPCSSKLVSFSGAKTFSVELAK